MILKYCATWLERRGIDDAVGAVTVHGTIGIYGVVLLGIFGSAFLLLEEMLGFQQSRYTDK